MGNLVYRTKQQVISAGIADSQITGMFALQAFPGNWVPANPAGMTRILPERVQLAQQTK